MSNENVHPIFRPLINRLAGQKEDTVNKQSLELLQARMRIYCELADKYNLSVEDVAKLIAEYEEKIQPLYEEI